MIHRMRKFFEDIANMNFRKFYLLCFVLLLNLSFVTMVSAAWLDSAWTKRVKITIDQSKVVGPLVQFPIYIDLRHMPISFFNDCLANGADLRVTKSDGVTQLARELVFIQKTANAGELHFIADNLSQGASLEFYLYYGNNTAIEPAPNSTYGKNNVWINNYVGVWHLQEPANNFNRGYQDSTSYINHANGVSMALTAIKGKLSGKAQDFDGTADYIFVPNSNALENLTESSFTLSAWHYSDQVPENIPWYNSFDALICKPGEHTGIFYNYNANYLSTIWAGPLSYDINSNQKPINEWHYASQVVDAVNGARMESFFVDGNQQGSALYSGALRDYSTTPFKFGACNIPGIDWDWVLNGKLDEIRISKTNRSAAWIKTEFNNQSSPNTFYSISAVENR